MYEKLSAERKQAQEQELCPEWYTTGGYQLFKEKYQHQDSVKAQFELIARTAANHLKGLGSEVEQQGYDKFFEMLWKGWFSPSTPILANMGTTRGLPVSCSGNFVDDSVEGFYDAYKEVALLSKQGFGTSSYLGNIRPRGAAISVGGKADGVMPVFKHFIQVAREVSQGMSRRGSWAGYIEITHSDFDELADFIMSDPEDANIGWILTDEFLSEMEVGNKDYLRRYQKAMKLKMVTGKGYFCKIDEVNRHRPEMYVDKGMTVKASNLCVAPETVILTDKGYLTIGELKNEVVNVWNGKEFSEVTVRQTSKKSKLLHVVTSAGYELDCTPDHKFHVVTGYGKDKVIVKRTSELEVGDKLIKSDYPVIQGDDELEFAYDNGFYSADGCYFEGRQIIYLYHEKRELINQFPSVVRWYEQADQKRLVGTAKGLRDKFFVPAANYTIQSKLEWFAGLCDGDGTIARNGTNEALQISSTQKRFLLDTQLLLQTLGIPSKVTKNVDEGMKMLPANDGSGELKAFFCQTTYRLLISSSALFKLKLLGFKTFRLQWKGEMPQREAEQFTRVVSVTDEGRKDATYCFTEHKRHLGVFNGLLTGNCNEIMLFSDINHTFTCIVSSLNVAKYREWQNTDTPFWATVFLDCVCEEFIQRARDISGLERAVRFTEKGRALGLGQCGLHTLFQQEMLPFEGLEAHLLSTSISKQIAEESLRASQWMAQVLGEPEWCKGYGVRNTHRTAIMPTKSTALLMGGVSEGINPDPAMTFTQMTAGGEVERVNPILLPLMKERGVYNKDTIRGMKQAMGSVQHVTWLTEEEKEVFKTAFELNQSVIIRMAATRTKNLCQWQSLNLFFSAEAHESEVSRVHQEALLNKDILGLYYVYSSAGVQAATGECIACQ